MIWSIYYESVQMFASAFLSLTNRCVIKNLRDTDFQHIVKPFFAHILGRSSAYQILKDFKKLINEVEY